MKKGSEERQKERQKKTERKSRRKEESEIEKKKKVRTANIGNSIAISTAGDCRRF